MFKLSKKTEYGLLALQYLSARTSGMATVREISEYHNISKTLLAKILQMLAKKRIVESVQGAQGGYVLAMDPDKVSIAGIVEAIEGPIHITDCYNKSADCDRSSSCTLRKRFSPLQSMIVKELNNVSLANFLKE